MTSPATLTLVAHQLRYDLRAFRRNRQALVSTLVLPVILLAVWSSANDGETTTTRAAPSRSRSTWCPAWWRSASIAASFLSLVVEVVAQRESGVLKRRRATPVTAAVLVAGRTLTAAVASIAVAWVLLAVAGKSLRRGRARAGLPALAAALLLGAVAFASLGYALASAIRTPAAAQPVASLVFLPFLLVSGVLVPADRLPARIAAVARIFPVEHLANAIRYALDPAVTGGHLAVADLAVLAAWAVGAFAVAHRRFQWLPRGR